MSAPELFAVISDIHGNVFALEAALTDIRARGVDTILNLGDHVHGPIEPAATADLLMATEATTISGNQDRVIPASTLERLGPEHLKWLRGLPATLSVDDILLCHGNPESDETYWLESVDVAGSRPATAEEVRERLGPGAAYSLVLCGHTHIPRVVQVANGPLVVNPGSVGLQAYTDDLPYPHKMETGIPHARYAVLARIADGWRVELIALPYDWKRAADTARRNGREDWAYRLETGRA